MTRRAASLTFLAAFALLLAAAPPPRKEDPPAAKVLAYAQKQKGQQVGNGECAVLALEALKSANAKPRATDDPNKEDYVWGTLVYTLDRAAGAKPQGKTTDVKPGAIVQFRDAKFRGRVPGGIYTEMFPHHTAIVAAVENNGNTIRILHQNHNGDRTVADGTLVLSDLKEGWLRFYHPVPR
jgi:hypothetical protein